MWRSVTGILVLLCDLVWQVSSGGWGWGVGGCVDGGGGGGGGGGGVLTYIDGMGALTSDA